MSWDTIHVLGMLIFELNEYSREKNLEIEEFNHRGKLGMLTTDDIYACTDYLCLF